MVDGWMVGRYDGYTEQQRGDTLCTILLSHTQTNRGTMEDMQDVMMTHEGHVWGRSMHGREIPLLYRWVG